LRPLTPSLRQWLILAVTLLVVLPLVVGIVFQNPIQDAYVHEFVSPRLQRELGFTAGWMKAEGQQAWVIRSVEPDGVLARAGFREGDEPSGYVHGVETGFLTDLEHGDGARSIPVYNLHDRTFRRVTLPARPGA
jgi:hypothetical protein